MNDFVRVASAVINTTVADTTKNTEEHIKMMEKSSKENVDITVFPELSITGYTCQDLFFQKELLDKTYSSLIEIKKKSEKLKGIFVVGAPIKHKNQLFNCAVVISNGTVYGIVPKTYLPNYNEFYEKRWFSTSMDLEDTFINFDGEEVPFSQNVFDAKGFTFGVEICEDLWTPIPPSTVLSMSGAEIILNLSASNALIGKRDYVNSMVKQNSGSNIATYVYCSAGSGESTQDLIYSGHSIICENGVILKENKEIIENNYLLITDTDLGKIRFDRLKNKSYKDCITNNMFSTFDTVNVDYLSDSEIVTKGEMYYIDKTPFVPSNNSKKLERCLEIFSMQVEGLRKRISVIGGKMVVGVSGGLDSTLALLVCGEVCRRMGKPMTDVVGVTMPCFGTTDRTYNNSLDLMRTLGITTMEIPIADSCRQHMKDIGHNEEVHDITYENVQARERTQVLMDVANKVGGIVVGTGDLSELALGWCTYNADHMSMYGVNASIPKTLIKWMIDAVAKNNIFKDSTATLEDIIDTPISPELLPPTKDGKIAQKTEEKVGPYLLHDFFLYYVLRFSFRPKKIYSLAVTAFDGEFDKDTIKKWLKTFYHRFFTQQFKRSCLPDCVKVGSVCLSPRGDWRMPTDSSAKLWLDEVESL
ncbi:MAG: NAD(+) synthase [Ruminococcus sp.]|nr:NAD(+) synthase [Ruminococcus sp.]MCI6505173.1 NAD(+) synthase [Ruminococcus sp.]